MPGAQDYAGRASGPYRDSTGYSGPLGDYDSAIGYDDPIAWSEPGSYTDPNTTYASATPYAPVEVGDYVEPGVSYRGAGASYKRYASRLGNYEADYLSYDDPVAYNVPVQAEPNMPTNVQAVPTLVYIGEQVLISWDYSDPREDPQTAYQLRWRKVQ